jgi:hypothetical protein
MILGGFEIGVSQPCALTHAVEQRCVLVNVGQQPLTQRLTKALPCTALPKHDAIRDSTQSPLR